MSRRDYKVKGAPGMVVHREMNNGKWNGREWTIDYEPGVKITPLVEAAVVYAWEAHCPCDTKREAIEYAQIEYAYHAELERLGWPGDAGAGG